MPTCDVPPSPSLHPALAGRFSPTAFDPGFVVDDDQIDSLLDAARQAPSAGNSQPWAFIVGQRGDAVHRRIVRHLAGSSSRWATDASVLLVNLAHVDVAEGLQYSEFSRYDLGQAVAHLTIQGLHLGLQARQFRAFDREAVAAEFAIPPEWEVSTMTALGVAATTGSVASPERATRDEITWMRAYGARPQ